MPPTEWIDSTSILATLEGTWRGRGTATLPSMEPVGYEEEIRFSRLNPTSLDYWQRAVARADGSMLHSESGIWRVAGPGLLEITVALPGATEVSEGTIKVGAIDLASRVIGLTTTGPRLIATTRAYDLADDLLLSRLSISTEGFSTVQHIRAVLRRESK